MPIHVLNVDHDGRSRARRSGILRARDYSVSEAATGADAVDLATVGLPDVVLAAADLSDVGGTEVCRRIKAHPACAQTVVILVAAEEPPPHVVLDGFAAGADVYLHEGIDEAVLPVFIDAAVRWRRAIVDLEPDRAQAQLELTETLRRYRSMFDHAPYGICHLLEDGTVLDGNRAFVDLIGCATLDEARLVDMNGIYEDASVREAVVAGWRTRGTGKAEVVWRCPDGRRIHVAISGRVLEHNAELFEVFVEDITERKRLEADFHHKRKMEAIGRLAGGVAHDMNNWLTVIAGYAEMLLDETPDGAARGGLQEILTASRAATGITRNLLTFSRKQVLQLRTTDLNAAVTEFHQLLDRIIGEQIQIDLDLADEPVHLKADPTQIQQVLMNLAVNARDAMPEGGRLTVRTGTADLQEGSIPGKHVAAGPYAYVMVSDTGVGMSAEIRERLFEPFFTTKDAGKGTGLGMAVVYGIVKQLDGGIAVESEPGIGTTFTIYFPLVGADAPVAASRTRLEAPGLDRRRILLVEDDDSVRTLTRRMLERSGYDVVPAANGEEALHLFATATEPIALVLTDVVMPGLSGPEMLERMLLERAVPALLISGYPDQGGAVEARRQFRLVPKPFTAEALVSAIRETLDAAAGSVA